MWVAEFSEKQKCFHIQELNDAISKNETSLKNFICNNQYLPDYVIFAMNNNKDVLVKLCNKYSKVLQK
jgi:hypothetical protein